MKIIAIIFITGCFWLAIEQWAKTPVVYISTRTGKCVKVITDGVECSCENIPSKYEKIYVK